MTIIMRYDNSYAFKVQEQDTNNSNKYNLTKINSSESFPGFINRTNCPTHGGYNSRSEQCDSDSSYDCKNSAQSFQMGQGKIDGALL